MKLLKVIQLVTKLEFEPKLLPPKPMFLLLVINGLPQFGFWPRKVGQLGKVWPEGTLPGL